MNEGVIAPGNQLILIRCAEHHPYRRGTIHPRGLYSGRFVAMNHRRYIAWYHSSAQVIVATPVPQ